MPSRDSNPALSQVLQNRTKVQPEGSEGLASWCGPLGQHRTTEREAVELRWHRPEPGKVQDDEKLYSSALESNTFLLNDSTKEQELGTGALHTRTKSYRKGLQRHQHKLHTRGLPPQ